ncbi:MAG: hypothetical protein LBN23_08235 [Paludibacter sp.]|jgi:uncharacterized protein YndB with AHSA1/START domain|nr:hypothetical protein [Paludibacter sp.]
MTKQKVILEYHLNKVAVNRVWNFIDNSHGLADWFADEVSEQGDIFTFHWGKDHVQEAVLKKKKELVYMRFQWLEDKDSDCFFEIRLQFQELTRDLMLIVTDFAEADETEDLKMLWQQQIDTLCRKLGI